uniref:Uncharacterized protein n=1 Tax=viral metagenome TaxID=1070528 RepID=A0A6M3LJ85_9ZZZZ
MKAVITIVIALTVLSILFPWHFFEMSRSNDTYIQFYLSELYPYLLCIWMYTAYSIGYGHPIVITKTNDNKITLIISLFNSTLYVKDWRKHPIRHSHK